MVSPHSHTTEHRRERGSLKDTGSSGSCVGADSCLILRGHVAGKPCLQCASFSSRVRESDVQSSEGLHQGDLRVHVCFSAPVSAAISVLQGFEAVPLLLTLLLLQPLLFPPLLVCDLRALALLTRSALFTRAGPSLTGLHSAFVSALISRESGAAACLVLPNLLYFL